MKRLIYWCLGFKKDYFKQKKIGDKIKEMKEVKEDPRSRMWKQVIKKNDGEKKRNEIEDLRQKTVGIEDKVEKIKSDMETTIKKLQEIENEARIDHEQRKLELKNSMKDFKTDLDVRKEQENIQRSMETERTIMFMGNLGNFITTPRIVGIITNMF